MRKTLLLLATLALSLTALTSSGSRSSANRLLYSLFF
jgi:hypothetical protein